MRLSAGDDNGVRTRGQVQSPGWRGWLAGLVLVVLVVEGTVPVTLFAQPANGTAAISSGDTLPPIQRAEEIAAPPFYKRWWFWAIVVAAVAGGVAIAASGGGGNGGAAGPSGSVTVTGPPPP